MYIEIEKMSKKLKREYFKKYRNDWNGINPVTKKIQSKKVYNRTRNKNDKGNNAMYKYEYQPVVKITNGQEKKHYSQMTADEIAFLKSRITAVRDSMSLSYHSIDKNNNVSLTDIKNILTSGNFAIIEYNETPGYNLDLRVVIRDNDTHMTNYFDSKLEYSYQAECSICFVLSIKTGTIITSYLNKFSDCHQSINFARYNQNLNIIK